MNRSEKNGSWKWASEGKSYLPRRGEPKRNSWEWGWGESHAPSFAVDTTTPKEALHLPGPQALHTAPKK